MTTFARLDIPIYSLLAALLGYGFIRAMKTWWLRACFFLTLLAVVILAKSLHGIALTVVPTIISIIGFELEMRKEKTVARYEESRDEKFAMFPIRKWDCRTPLVVFDTDQYLLDEESVYEYIGSVPEEEQIRICECRPVFLERVDEEDLLGGNGDVVLPVHVERALAALNRAILQCDPICWEQTDIAIDVDDLRERAKLRMSVQTSS